MSFNIYNILIIAGVIQGFVFCGLVLTSKKFRSKSTLLLTSLIFTYSLGNLQYVLADIGSMDLESMYRYVYLPWASIIPALIYLYGVHFLDEAGAHKRLRLLLLPFIVSVVIVLVFKIGFLLGIDSVSYYQNYKWFVNVHEIFSVLFSIVLVPLLLKKVTTYKRTHRVYHPRIIRSNVNWLQFTLWVIFLFTIIWAYLTYRNLFVPDAQPDFYILWIGVAATIYWLGHIGIYKYGIKAERKHIRNARVIHDQESGSDTMVINKHITAFEKLLRHDKKFLDSTLTLDKVAEELELSASYLSRLINSELGMSFTDYLNALRIDEAKTYLLNPEFAKYTITSIGLEAGFNSKSAFYEIFKKLTGQTPLVFKNRLDN
jgi:AraC-like DNA-binding protein